MALNLNSQRLPNIMIGNNNYMTINETSHSDHYTTDGADSLCANGRQHGHYDPSLLPSMFLE